MFFLMEIGMGFFPKRMSFQYFLLLWISVLLIPGCQKGPLMTQFSMDSSGSNGDGGGDGSIEDGTSESDSPCVEGESSCNPDLPDATQEDPSGGDSTPQWVAMPLRTKNQVEAGHAGGEGLQAVQTIAFAPTNEKVVYLGVDTSNVWKSLDGGLSWTPKPSGFRAEGVRSLGVDPLNENVVFAAGMNPDYDTPVTGIYRTLDGAESFELVKRTYYSKIIDGVKKISAEGQFFAFDLNSFDGTRCQTVYAGTHGSGVMKSTDGGSTWTVLALDGKRVSDIALVSLSSTTNVIYVATNDKGSSGKGLYKISDSSGGVSVSALGNLPNYPRTLAVDGRTPEKPTIYVGAGPSGAYKSTDGGASFVRLSTGASYIGIDHDTVVISPSNPEYIYVSFYLNTTRNPLYSRDGGVTWNAPTSLDVGKLSATGYGIYYNVPVAFHPTNEMVAVSYHDQIVMRTEDGGGTWSFSGNGFMGGRRSENRSSTYFDPTDSNRMIYFLTDFGPFLTTDQGNSWKRLPVPESGLRSTPVGVSYSGADSNVIVAAVGEWNSQRIVRSQDGGETWTAITGTTGNFRFMAVHPQDKNCIYAGSRGGSDAPVGGWRSEDMGVTWTKITDKFIRVVSPNNGNIVYATEERNSNVVFWYSSDRGNQWIEIGSVPTASVYDVDIDFNSKVIYAAGGNGLYKCDEGRWTEIAKSNGLPGETFGETTFFTTWNVVADPKTSGTLYAGMVSGYGKRKQFIFRSVDYGQTWEDIGYNLPSPTRIWGLAVDPRDGSVHISISHGNFIFNP